MLDINVYKCGSVHTITVASESTRVNYLEYFDVAFICITSKVISHTIQIKLIYYVFSFGFMHVL